MPAEKKTTKKTKKKRPKSRKSTGTGVSMSPRKKTPAKKRAHPGSAAKKRTAKSADTVAAAPKTRNTEVAFPVVAIGASAGGLEAFETFFKAMPPDSGMAFILITHLDPTHVSHLPELLQKSTDMDVRQIRSAMKIKPNSVYVIPPNKDLNVFNGILHLVKFSQPHGANLPIDNFFRSLAQDQGARGIGIILSGTGADGTNGLKAIKGEIGMTMVQDEKSAKYDGMPRSAIATGLADYVLPPENMPEQLIKYAAKSTHVKTAPTVAPTPDVLQKILFFLHRRTGHDFSLYKKNTIYRRIERRMNIHQIDSISDYVRYLGGSEREVDFLFKELLIGTTNFFRDPEAFDTLKNELLLKLRASKQEGYTFRVWVPGCSSGEEAYSVAIILHECIESSQQFKVQIFATDIDQQAIALARDGRYPPNILPDVSPKRLQRYFTKEDDGRYRIKKIIREMLIFAPQNIITDPSFTKLDLLCCRNLLIYLGPELQRKLLHVFYYSLRSGGFLFLGSSENIGQHSDHFAQRSRKWKIFRRKSSSKTLHTGLDSPISVVLSEEKFKQPVIPEAFRKTETFGVQQLVETILAQSDTPPCIVIDDACNLVYVHGHTGKFLEPAQGKASVNALDMARPGVKTELATAIRKVSTHKHEVIQRDLRVVHNGGHITFDLIAKPILEQGPLADLMMIMFKEVSPAAKKPKTPILSRAARPQGRSAEELERELRYTKQNLQITIKELEISNIELKSINQELQATNEELQSTNEEMETSREELQSLNEESAIISAELQCRIDELSEANDDMKNLLDSTEIATIFLDTDFCIRRFTPSTTKIIPLSSVDSGRPIQHFASKLIDVNLVRHGKNVLKDLGVREVEVRTEDEFAYNMKVRPYRTVNNIIDGVVITFEDITERNKSEQALRESEERLRTIFEMSADSIVLVDVDSGAFIEFNQHAHATLGYTRQEFAKFTIADIEVIETSDEIDCHLKKTLREGGDVFESQHLAKNGEARHVRVESKVVSIRGKIFFQSTWRYTTQRGQYEKTKARN